MAESTKILIVDDDQSIAGLLSELLSDEGYSVNTVFRGDDALEELERNAYDLLLLDLMLPGVYGLDVFREISQRNPGTDVIIMTSQASLETAVEALRLGAQDYLAKPFEDLSIVTEVIRKTFDKRRIVEENVRLTESLKVKTAALETSVQRLSSLHHMSRALYSILDTRELLQYFVHLVASELTASRVSLMLLDEETEELTIEASVGLKQEVVESVRVREGEGVAGWVLRERKPVLVEDIDRDPRFKRRLDVDYNSDSFISAPVVLSVPLQYQQKMLGVVNVNNKQDGGLFTEDDLEFVATLAGQAAIAAQNARIFEQLKESHFQTISALAEALDAKDATTGKHCDRLLQLASEVGERLGLDSEQQTCLRYAAVLHDIGKIGISEAILQKPGKLTSEEYKQIRKHPKLGAEMVKRVRFLEPVAPLINAHHERYDGKGYPNQLSGEEIPIEARIIAVIDSYDAMSSNRPYREALSREEAIQELQDYAGTQFDPRVVEEFLAVIDEEEAPSSEQGCESERDLSAARNLVSKNLLDVDPKVS